ncbi:hypothetical protein BU25DRAFT_129935 [Macroventuria anomochaeta]|uniref:Uncharacterized protein n=1 Tax=Macroventuria anomochaeta TaxID=301207 RepID=A0ACB6RUM4_9PLEO|nr:uncharacterized protein BU25DRAFT_129935 [Macroventuria anomochaeta]KAF2624987.1 hypothetical protein BU25DRAFT_129935 [Macroventuria anomochaeta]
MKYSSGTQGRDAIVLDDLRASTTPSQEPSAPPPHRQAHTTSPPLSLSPAIAALKFACAYSGTSSSKLFGCRHTAGTPASLASLSSCSVTAGGVQCS